MNDTTRENTLEVDSEQLTRELEQLDIPQDTMTPGVNEAGAGAPTTSDALAPVPTAESWEPITPAIVSLVDLFICPAWHLTDHEKHELAAALAPALDQAFPGGLGDERWAPYARLLLVSGGIVLSRFDRKTGKLAPLRASENRAAPDLEGEPAAAPADQGAAGGAFTLGAGQAT